jgi:hypothetical protein
MSQEKYLLQKNTPLVHFSKNYVFLLKFSYAIVSTTMPTTPHKDNQNPHLSPTERKGFLLGEFI